MGQRHLRQFLGMTNHLHKFISNFSEKTAPLRELLRNDAHWSWEPAQQQAFDTLKADISQPPVLRYFDPSKPVTLSVDASKSGLGAVCLQDGFPVAYASRAITEAEIRYAQIEKELLSATSACRKFLDFIYGRQVTIKTDHKPITAIVNKPLHLAPVHLQRMLLHLQKYRFWHSVVPALQQCSTPPAERSSSHSPGSRPSLVLCKHRHVQLEWTAVPDTHWLLLWLVWDEHSQWLIF